MSATGFTIFEGRYSFTISNDDMAPMFGAGQTICVDPTRPPEPDKGVVLFNADRSRFIVREFVRSNQTQWVVRKYGDGYEPRKHPTGKEEKLLREEWPIAEIILAAQWG